MLIRLLPPPFTAKPYNAEFYFDTPNPVRILKGNNYSYNLQWTQKDPEATDRIIGYWINVRKVMEFDTNIRPQHRPTLTAHGNTLAFVFSLSSVKLSLIR